MSVIYLTEHNESIYDVIKKSEKRIPKPPTHISVYSKAIREKFKSPKQKGHGTMGLPEYTPEDPQNFLKKHSVKKMPEKPKKITLKVRELQVPRHDDIPKRKHNCEDMIRKNIKHVKTLDPPKIVPKCVYTRFGATHVLAKSVSEIIDKNKQSVGSPPNYLIKRMEVKELVEKARKDAEEIKKLPKCRYLTRQQRDDLLNGLKKNWEELQKEFQLLPMIVDTIPKIAKKVKLEEILNVLEKDIRLIEKHSYIYIDENDSVYDETRTVTED